MDKVDLVWKLVLALAVAIVVIGALLIGTSFITGASSERVMTGLGGAEGLREVARNLWQELFP